MFYCAKSEPESESEPESDPEPDLEPDPESDPEPEPSVNSQLYMPDWSGIICPHGQAEECTDVHCYNVRYWVCFDWKEMLRLSWPVINHLLWIPECV